MTATHEHRPQEQARPGTAERRWPATLALLVATALYTLLPSALLVGPRVVVPALEVLLLLPLIVADRRRRPLSDNLLRRLSIALILVIAVTNAVALVLLVKELTSGDASQGRPLLLAAGQVWLTNILVFALAYWELDRGGPAARAAVHRPRLASADFRFPQDEDHDAISEVSRRSSALSGWRPGFVDYLYVSVTNSSAFSPTDTMPLSPRAKMLMAAESVSALALSVLVIARGVGLLQG